MADNPISWFFLTIIGIYFICCFLKKIINKNGCIKSERREKVYQEIFLESPIDKRNIAAYNRYINKRGRNQ